MRVNGCNRHFLWMSSSTGREDVLKALHNEMSAFYSQQGRRERYQQMLNQQEEVIPAADSVRHLMPKYVYDLKPARILEIGCGEGRLYRQLRGYGYTAEYVGIDVAEYLIHDNERRHPEAEWKVANVYRIPYEEGSFDICFSLYVLEHLVYPESALREMVRVLRPRGRVVLVFPDIAQSGRMGSQQRGFSPMGTASEKLRKGKLVDAVVSLYDSRFRLPKALRDAPSNFGPFPINTRPICLYHSSLMAPDIDAVYIASKQEVQSWAERNNLMVEYPCGTQGEFAEQAFIVLTKL
jgi:SAM-dependent methyltransferase